MSRDPSGPQKTSGSEHMLKCPHCKTDLSKMGAFPEVCPSCGLGLSRPGSESASVQLLRDSADLSGLDAGGTMQSDDASLGSGSGSVGSGSGSAAVDDPNSSKTFVSDQWDDPLAAEAPSK